ncbi:MAG: hypothetical protein ABR503_09325 [Chitinophagaceae bacterium]
MDYKQMSVQPFAGENIFPANLVATCMTKRDAQQSLPPVFVLTPHLYSRLRMKEDGVHALRERRLEYDHSFLFVELFNLYHFNYKKIRQYMCRIFSIISIDVTYCLIIKFCVHIIFLHFLFHAVINSIPVMPTAFIYTPF